MNKYFNKLLQISAVSVVMASTVCADQSNNTNTNNGANGQQCVITPLCPMYPHLKDPYYVHMDIGYLLEQFVLTGTDFANYTTPAYTPLPTVATVLRPKFNVASGLTAGLGYYFTHDDWFLNARFDWVSRKGRKNVTGTNQIVPLGLWTPGLLGGATTPVYFSSVRDTLKVSYYMLELEVNKGSYLTEHFAVEPHAGLKSAFIYYTGNTTYTGGATGVNSVYRNQSTKFWGVGPTLGVDSTWKFGDGFSSFCETSVALLTGDSKVSDSTVYNTSAVYTTSASESFLVMSPTARAIIGFQYCTGMFDDSQGIRVRVALDTSYYWNQFQHMSVVNESPTTSSSKYFFADNGGFGMIGLIVDLGWDF